MKILNLVVPGPKEEIYFIDKKISKMMFWVPSSGDVGLGFSILSYSNQVFIGCIVDQNLTKDANEIIKYFEEEFNNLYERAKELK